MIWPEELEGKIARLLISEQRRLVLLEILVLDGDVVQCNHHDCLAGLLIQGLATSSCVTT